MQKDVLGWTVQCSAALHSISRLRCVDAPRDLSGRPIAHQDDVDAIRAVRAESDGLLDIRATGGPGNEVDRTRRHFQLVPQELPGFLHPAHDTRGAHYRDVRFRQQARRRPP